MMIRQSVADVSVVSGCTLYLRGLKAHRRAAIESAWSFLAGEGFRHRLAWCRTGTQTVWSLLGDARAPAGDWLDAVPCRRLQACSAREADAFSVEIVDLDPLLGEERASSINITFPNNEDPSTMVRVASWAVAHLPFWWGTAGWFFAARGGQPGTDWAAIAASAKRCWAVQIAEPAAMQWDALAGLHTVGWLTLVSHEMATAARLLLPELPDGDAPVYRRRGRYGAVLAAGPAPLLGDINLHESLASYRAVNDMLQPLLLQAAHPWPGVFSHAELRRAWIGRFSTPQAWLSASIEVD